MNFSSMLGILLAFTVFGWSLLTATKDYKVFADMHALVLVLGGTLAATLTSFSVKNVMAMVKVFFGRVLKNALSRYDELIQELVDLAKGYRENDGYLTQKVNDLKNPFLKEAVQLMIDGSLEPAELDSVLKKRATTHFARYEQDADMFKALSKFPPAFGLLGAVLGIIGMMQNLGGADAIKTVGPSLAVALVATLYGIAVANFVFVPLGENLSKFNKSDMVLRQMVMDGVKMLRAKKHPIVMEENLKSFLLPSERDKMTKAA